MSHTSGSHLFNSLIQNQNAELCTVFIIPRRERNELHLSFKRSRLTDHMKLLQLYIWPNVIV